MAERIIYKKDAPLKITTVQEAIDQSFSQRNYVSFNCELCNDVKVKLAISVRASGNLICGPCLRKKTYIEKFGVDNPAKSNSIKEKTKKTCLEKYGTENPAQAESVKEKIKKSTIDRYGVESTLQVKEFREKGKKTRKEIYGDENYNNTEKAAKTCLERFGVTSPAKNEEVKNKIKETNIRRYGSTCLVHNKDQSNNDNINLSRFENSNYIIHGKIDKE